MLNNSNGSACVLVVEDDLNSRSLLCRLLRHDGYACRGVGSCAEALAAHAESPCNVLLCDLVLPDGEGTTLLRKIRATPGGRGVCGIAFTGRVGPAEEAEARAAGFAHFVAKPATFDTLRTAIAETCGLLAGARATA